MGKNMNRDIVVKQKTRRSSIKKWNFLKLFFYSSIHRISENISQGKSHYTNLICNVITFRVTEYTNINLHLYAQDSVAMNCE